MSLTYFVAGRSRLPTSNRRRWSIELSDEEDEDYGVEIHQIEVTPWLADQVGFRPLSAVSLSPAWQASEAVASELAQALGGAVFCEVTQKVIFDARGSTAPCASLSELEARLVNAFERQQDE